MENLEKSFKEIIKQIKFEIQNTQVAILSKANQELLKLYFNIGKYIFENSSWGDKFVDNLAIEIKIEFPNIKGFSVRNLKNMKKFYAEYSENEIMQTASAQIPFSHNILLIERVKDIEIRKWYIEEIIKNGWTYSVLNFQIDTDLYSRQALLDNKLNNFDDRLDFIQSGLAKEMQKDPYIFNLPLLKKKYIESELENALVEKIKDTLLELGNGFSFVGHQYKLTVGDEDFFIDMLFYHLKLRCYVVIELKTVPFKPEFTGKLNFYLSAIDDMLRNEYDNPTIGLLLCADKEKNRLSVEYSLRDINKPIGVSSYEVTKILPKELLDSLPTEEDINLHIDLQA